MSVFQKLNFSFQLDPFQKGLQVKTKKRKGLINLSLTVAGTGIEPVFAP